MEILPFIYKRIKDTITGIMNISPPIVGVPSFFKCLSLIK